MNVARRTTSVLHANEASAILDAMNMANIFFFKMCSVAIPCNSRYCQTIKIGIEACDQIKNKH